VVFRQGRTDLEPGRGPPRTGSLPERRRYGRSTVDAGFARRRAWAKGKFLFPAARAKWKVPRRGDRAGGEQARSADSRQPHCSARDGPYYYWDEPTKRLLDIPRAIGFVGGAGFFGRVSRERRARQPRTNPANSWTDRYRYFTEFMSARWPPGGSATYGKRSAKMVGRPTRATSTAREGGRHREEVGGTPAHATRQKTKKFGALQRKQGRVSGREWRLAGCWPAEKKP